MIYIYPEYQTILQMDVRNMSLALAFWIERRFLYSNGKWNPIKLPRYYQHFPKEMGCEVGKICINSIPIEN